MKKRIISVLIVLVVLASLNVGCGQGKSNSLIEMLKILPQDSAEITFFDIATLESDADLEHWYSDLKGDWFFRADLIPELNSSNIHTTGIAMRLGDFSNLMMIFKGELDEQGIRDMLVDEGFEAGEYEGIQIWTGELYSGAEPRSWAGALLEKTFLFGGTDNVEASIRVSQNMEPSLYKDNDVKSVVDRLPEGILCEIYNVTAILQEAGLTSAGLAGGFSLIKAASGKSLEIVGWSKFQNRTDAAAALTDLEEKMKELWDTTQVEGQLKGQYVEITGEMELP